MKKYSRKKLKLKRKIRNYKRGKKTKLKERKPSIRNERRTLKKRIMN